MLETLKFLENEILSGENTNPSSSFVFNNAEIVVTADVLDIAYTKIVAFRAYDGAGNYICSSSKKLGSENYSAVMKEFSKRIGKYLEFVHITQAEGIKL